MPSTKYVIVIPDGAADEPFSELDGMTPLEAARIPEMDRIAREGIIGRSRNVPDRFLPASDVATLSLLGYDPERYYTGRAPLEAAAMGIDAGSRRLGDPVQPDDDQRRAAHRLHRRPHHQRRGPAIDRGDPGRAGRPADRVSPRGQLPQPDGLSGPAGRAVRSATRR